MMFCKRIMVYTIFYNILYFTVLHIREIFSCCLKNIYMHKTFVRLCSSRRGIGRIIGHQSCKKIAGEAQRELTLTPTELARSDRMHTMPGEFFLGAAHPYRSYAHGA